MQKARASLWKIKPEWLTQTDWNMDENHGNRLFSKQFMEAHSETRHLGKEPCANQRIPTPPATKISQEQMCQASLPLPLLARREQPHKLSAVVVLSAWVYKTQSYSPVRPIRAAKVSGVASVFKLQKSPHYAFCPCFGVHIRQRLSCLTANEKETRETHETAS